MGADAVAILLGAGLATRSRDTQFPFRQDSDFFYLTGFDHPGAVAVLAHDRRARLHALRRAARPGDGDLERLPAGCRGRARDYEADEAHAERRVSRPHPRAAAQGAPHLPRAGPRHGGRRAADRDARERAPALAPGPRAGRRDRRPPHARARHAPVQGAERARHPATRRGDQRRGPRRRGAPRACPARSSTSSRPRCSTPSAAAARAGPPTRRSSAAAATRRCCTTCATTRSCAEGELVLIDAGCELESYASDVTRTYPVGGRFSGAARATSTRWCSPPRRRRSSAAARARRCPRSTTSAVRRLVEGLLALGLLAGDRRRS